MRTYFPAEHISEGICFSERFARIQYSFERLVRVCRVWHPKKFNKFSATAFCWLGQITLRAVTGQITGICSRIVGAADSCRRRATRPVQGDCTAASGVARIQFSSSQITTDAIAPRLRYCSDHITHEGITEAGTPCFYATGIM